MWSSTIDNTIIAYRRRRSISVHRKPVNWPLAVKS